MRSWRRLALAALVAAAAMAAPGCGGDGDGDGDGSPDPAACETSYLDYQTFGAPFLLDWCAGCHSSALPLDMRQQAPAGVDFDTPEGVKQFAARIAVRAAGEAPTMPPAGGPSEEERALLVEWITCGAK